jgi:hypothetical protein
VGIPGNAFTVHKFLPEDFLIVFATEQFRDRVATLPSLVYGHFSLFFCRWTRLAQARRVPAASRVHLGIEGIPPHAWDVSTVEHLLGTAAAIDELAQESASRANLGIFRVSA